MKPFTQTMDKEKLKEYQREVNDLVISLGDLYLKLKNIDKDFLNNEFGDAYKFVNIIKTIDSIKWPITVVLCWATLWGLVAFSSGASA